MSLLFIDGFDDRRTTVSFFDLVKGWTAEGGNADINGTIGRFGSAGVDLIGNNWNIKRPIVNTDPTIIIGFAMEPVTITGANNDWFLTLYGDSASVTHVTLGLRADGSIGAYRGPASALLGQSAVSVLTGVGSYDYIECKVLISDTVGTVDVQVNGVNVLSLTGQDTKNGGTNSFIDGVDFRGATNHGWFMDDLYIANTQGTLNNDFLGDVNVETKFPNAEGTTIQWTPSVGVDNSANVDEQPPDGVDVNTDSTVGNIDMYETENMVDNANDVFGVQVSSHVSKDDAGSRGFRHRVDSAATIATGVDHALSTGVGQFVDMFETDPDGGALWTGAKYDAAEFGVETRA